VHVRVDEPRGDVLTGGIERFAPLVGAETGDVAVDDRDVRFEPLARERREDAAAAHDEIGRLVSARDGEATREW